MICSKNMINFTIENAKNDVKLQYNSILRIQDYQIRNLRKMKYPPEEILIVFNAFHNVLWLCNLKY